MAERPSTTGYRLLVFDWDGTILDSIGTIVACTAATLAELGRPPVDEQVIRDGIGLGIRETVERLAPGCDDELFQRVLEVYRDLWLAEYHHRSPLVPGARETLEQLAEAGYFLAVATAKGREGLARDLRRTGLGGHFLATRTVDEAPSKPHPGMLLQLLDEFGVAAGQSLMIGDSLHDLQMAQNAGVGAIAVETGSQRRRELEATSPLACLPSVAALPAWLAAR